MTLLFSFSNISSNGQLSRTKRHIWPLLGKNAIEESGFFTIWVLGLCMCLFALGGLSFDLWNGFGQRRELASIADAATVVGASQIQIDTFKTTGAVVIDPVQARTKAIDYIGRSAERNNIELTEANVTITGNQIHVELKSNLDVTLVKILSPTSEPYTVRVTSTSEPVPS